jgi:uncharacterized membrane protein YfcA
MPIEIWVFAFLITAGAATIQGTVGVGFAMVSVPILSLAHPDLAPAPQLLMAFPLTIAMAFRERHAVDLTGVGWIVGGRIPGAFFGVFLLGIATERMLDMFIGLVVLGAVVVIGTGFRLKRNRVTKTLAGVASGTTGVVSAIGGPPVALLYSRDEADMIRSTMAVVFAFGTTTSTVFRWASGNVTMVDVRVALILVPAVLGGLWISARYNERIPQRVVRLGILVVCAGSASALIIRSILG